MGQLEFCCNVIHQKITDPKNIVLVPIKDYSI